MKKMMMSLLLALMLTLVPSCLLAAEFVEIYRDREYLIYLETSSIQDHGTYYQAWTKRVYLGEAKNEESKRYNKKVDFVMVLSAYAKKTKQDSFLAIHVYAEDGKSIESKDFSNLPISWNSVVPDSIGEIIIEAVYFFAGK